MTVLLELGDPVTSLRDMLSHPFMRYAFIAGTATAIPAGLVSYFIVLRRQVFSGDALGHAAFTGALAALAFGIDLRLGLFAVTVASALLIGALGEKARADDVAIGSFFAWVLGLGVLFLFIFTTSRSTGNGAGGVRVLFGSIFGLDSSHTWVSVGVGALVTLGILAIARPLLFASVDEGVAEARRIPVRLLGLAFLALVGISAAQASQAIGALLTLGLLAAPGGIAQRLTSRPYFGMLISVGTAVSSVWTGLVLSYEIPRWPPSFSILAVASGLYVVVIISTTIVHFAQPRSATLDLADSSA